MKRTVLAILLAALTLTALLCGCNPETEPDAPTTDTTADWTPSAPQELNLAALLTADDAEKAFHTEFKDSPAKESGEITYVSADMQVQVTLLYEELTVSGEEYLQALSAQYAEGALTEAPNLGDRALWCAETGELMAVQDNMAISLNVLADRDAETLLLAARQLASTVLERLYKNDLS